MIEPLATLVHAVTSRGRWLPSYRRHGQVQQQAATWRAEREYYFEEWDAAEFRGIWVSD